MRAKTVNFERGKDPKEALEIGNRNLRDFNHMLKSKQCYSEPMQPMILGLLEGSVNELDAVKFVEKAIIQYDTRRSLAWYKDFNEEANCFWDNQGEVFLIIFEMPAVDFLDITKYRKIYTKILKSENFIHRDHYAIQSYLKITQDDGSIDELFHESNLFYPDDENFKMSNVIHLINKVVEETIKYTD